MIWALFRNRVRQVLEAIYILTIIDVVSTIIGIKLRLMTEANVIMDHVFRAIGLEAAGIIILLTVGFGLILIYRVKDMVPWLPAALALLLFIKIVVVILHVLIWGWYAGILYPMYP